jgi:putative oxidoreductase
VFDRAALRLTWEPRMLSILRIMVGLLYLQHGLNKFFNFPPTPNHAAYILFSLVPGVAGILETFGSVLIILGLFTRPAAFILSGEMAYAYFTVWAPKGFFPFPNGGDATVLYCFIFFYFFVVGAGVWSIDQLRASRNSAGGRA